MKADRAILAARSWAIPAICGLIVLHHDFKGGRFANVRRLIWTQLSVEVHLVYGTASVTGPDTASLHAIFTLHQNGTVIVRSDNGSPNHGELNILRFLAGEASREAARWSMDLNSWTAGSLNNDVKSAFFSMMSAAIALPFTDVDVVAEKQISNACSIRKIRIVHGGSTSEIISVGNYGVNVCQTGNDPQDTIRIRYVESDMRLVPSNELRAWSRFLGNSRDGFLLLLLLPVEAIAYVFEKKQMADLRAAGSFVDDLPNLPFDARADSGMSALSN